MGAAIPRSTGDPEPPSPEVLAEAARMLRELVAAARPHELRGDRATARRLEGAAAALEALAVPSRDG